jgi:2-(1,2-epoxy-1,2-dihydrophenyl)acetyl-CoA isomerase
VTDSVLCEQDGAVATITLNRPEARNALTAESKAARLAGLAVATELLMLAEPVPAERALSLGLVTSVADDEELAGAARELAARLAAGPTAAYGAIKEGLAYAATHGLADSLEKEAQLQDALGTTQDHRAATIAFVRKEQPVYHGR